MRHNHQSALRCGTSFQISKYHLLTISNRKFNFFPNFGIFIRWKVLSNKIYFTWNFGKQVAQCRLLTTPQHYKHKHCKHSPCTSLCLCDGNWNRRIARMKLSDGTSANMNIEQVYICYENFHHEKLNIISNATCTWRCLCLFMNQIGPKTPSNALI